MTIINTPLVLLAQQCGGTFHTPGPTRAIRGMCFTFEQLEAFAKRVRSVNSVIEVSAHSKVPQSAIDEHKN